MTTKRFLLQCLAVSIGLLIGTNHSHAQWQERLDSLNAVARDTMSDRTSVGHLYQIAATYYRLKQDTAVDIMYKVRDLSNKLENKAYQTRAMYFLGSIHGNQGNFDSAVYYLSDAREVIKTLNDTLRLIKHSNRLGLWLYAAKRYDESIALYHETLALADDKTDLDLIARAHLGLAQSWFAKGDYHTTLDYLLKAIKDEDTGKLTLYTRSTVYEFLTTLTSDLKQYDEALKYNKISYQLFEERQYPPGMIAESLKAGLIYFNRDQWDELEVEMDNALKLSNEHNIDKYLTGIYSLIGKKMQKDGNTAEAIRYFEMQKKEAEVGEIDLEKVNAYCNLGSIYIDVERYDEARYYSDIARDMLIEMIEEESDRTAMRLMLYITGHLSHLDSVANDEIGSLKHYREYIKYKEQLFDLEKSDAIAALRTSHESEKQDKDIELLAAKNKVQMAQHRKEQDLMVASIIGAVLLVVLLVLIYKRYTLKNKAFNTIKTQKTDIEERHSINEKLIDEIHHRVKNNLQIMLSMLNAQGYLLKNDDRAKSIIKESQNRIRSLALIHNNLHQSGRYLIVGAKHYIEDLATQVKESFGQKAQNIELVTDIEDTEISMNFAVPLGLIINELSTNAIKHAFQEQPTEPTLTVKFAKTGTGTYELTLSDNGIGFPPDFDMTSSSNFGLHIVNGLTQQLQGEMTVSSDCGICFNFTLKDQVIREKKELAYA
ncbi:MAG: histidine kinase dimerization/phosphoacceptor domain -containing protein [Bacteroidota bacterium]